MEYEYAFLREKNIIWNEFKILFFLNEAYLSLMENIYTVDFLFSTLFNEVATLKFNLLLAQLNINKSVYFSWTEIY